MCINRKKISLYVRQCRQRPTWVNEKLGRRPWLGARGKYGEPEPESRR